MINDVKQLVEQEMAGETEVHGQYLPQCHFVDQIKSVRDE
jgi:hypothetical protein